MRAYLGVIGAIAATIVLSHPARAQVQVRPTDPPVVNAAGESWYQLREPLAFAGDFYYRAGAAVFFNGNVMVRTGHYNGVPLYADTTLEPYSVVYVPIGRGLLQPYERLRRGDLAGTVGSRPPSFPIERRPSGTATFTAGASPTSLPAAIGAISAFTPELSSPDPAGVASVGTAQQPATAPAVVTAGSAAAPARTAVATLVGALTNDGVWVDFSGGRWISSGRAVPRSSDMEQIGDRAGFPVLQRRAAGDVIYLPTRAGVVAPYRRKG
jgi:hypothetical protein